jgi:hypothetical protein
MKCDEIPCDRISYRMRNLGVALEDWRRAAIRYDKAADNYLSGVYLAATRVD